MSSNDDYPFDNPKILGKGSQFDEALRTILDEPSDYVQGLLLVELTVEFSDRFDERSFAKIAERIPKTKRCLSGVAFRHFTLPQGDRTLLELYGFTSDEGLPSESEPLKVNVFIPKEVDSIRTLYTRSWALRPLKSFVETVLPNFLARGKRGNEEERYEDSKCYNSKMISYKRERSEWVPDPQHFDLIVELANEIISVAGTVFRTAFIREHGDMRILTGNEIESLQVYSESFNNLIHGTIIFELYVLVRRLPLRLPNEPLPECPDMKNELYKRLSTYVSYGVPHEAPGEILSEIFIGLPKDYTKKFLTKLRTRANESKEYFRSYDFYRPEADKKRFTLNEFIEKYPDIGDY